jgi:uncharacterized membrane protein (DUF2068 family)
LVSARVTTLHAIALFEGIKGIAAIAASAGILGLAQHDVSAMAYALIGHFHMDPAVYYPRLLLDGAEVLANDNLRQLVLLAWGYAAIRLTEGYGLWRDRAWAEWLAALSGGIYVPFELQHLVNSANVVNGLVLACNIAIVAYMAFRLRQRRVAVRPRAH